MADKTPNPTPLPPAGFTGSTAAWHELSEDERLAIENLHDTDATTHSTVMAALLHYGLTCYDGRHCIVALDDLGMHDAARALDVALSGRIYTAPGVRDWAAEAAAAPVAGQEPEGNRMQEWLSTPVTVDPDRRKPVVPVERQAGK